MYKFERVLNMDVDKAYGKLSQGLKEKGYVILSYVDVKEIIKNKFNEDFPGYYILDVCKPAAAKELITRNEEYGLFLPCKIVISGIGVSAKISMLMVSEMAQKHLQDSPEHAKKYEDELVGVINSIDSP